MIVDYWIELIHRIIIALLLECLRYNDLFAQKLLVLKMHSKRQLASRKFSKYLEGVQWQSLAH